MKKVYVLIGLLMFMLVMSGCGGGSNDNTSTETATTESVTENSDNTSTETATTETVTENTETVTENNDEEEELVPNIIGEWKGLCLPIEQAGTSLTRTLFVINAEDIIVVTKRYSTSIQCDGVNSTETTNRVYVIGEKIENTLYEFELTGTTAQRIDILGTTLEIYFHGTYEPDIYNKQ